MTSHNWGGTFSLPVNGVNNVNAEKQYPYLTFRCYERRERVGIGSNFISTSRVSLNSNKKGVYVLGVHTVHTVHII